MSDDEFETALAGRTRVLQIIVGALTNGVVMMGAIALVVGPVNPLAAGALPLVSLIGLPLLLGTLVARAVLLSVIERTAFRQAGSGRVGWLTAFQARTILGAATLEGPALFFGVAYIVEGQWWALALTGCLAAALLVLHFPTRDGVRAWVERREMAEMG